MKRILSVLLLVIFIAGCKVSKEPLRNPVLSPTPSSIPTTISFTQTIVSPEEAIEDGAIQAQATESALEVLKRTHTVELKHFSFGDVADSIDGTQGGDGGRYWIFYVNGKMSDVGAGEYKIKNGDQIIWKFQKEGETL